MWGKITFVLTKFPLLGNFQNNPYVEQLCGTTSDFEAMGK